MYLLPFHPVSLWDVIIIILYLQMKKHAQKESNSQNQDAELSFLL